MIDDIVEIAVEIVGEVGAVLWDKRREKKKQQEAEDEKQRQADASHPYRRN